jgi:hypothetical protein
MSLGKDILCMGPGLYVCVILVETTLDTLVIVPCSGKDGTKIWQALRSGTKQDGFVDYPI